MKPLDFLLTGTLLVLPVAASAQDSVTQFQLVAAANNMQACRALDTSFTRPLTVTVQGGVATIKGSGGVDDRMKLVSPNVYQTMLQLSGGQMDITADLSVTPKKLTFVSKNLGCHWTGQPLP